MSNMNQGYFMAFQGYFYKSLWLKARFGIAEEGQRFLLLWFPPGEEGKAHVAA